MPDLELNDDDVSLTVALDAGGRWSRLRIGDLDLLGGMGDRVIEWGNYVMAPFAGRVRHGRLTWHGEQYHLPVNHPPHAIHGVTLDRTWQVLDHDRHSATLRCDFDHRWPWPGHAVQQLELAADRLRARIEVHADAVPMPGWTGFHPWFNRRLSRGDAARIAIDCGLLFPRDDEGMPSPATVPVPSPLPEQPWDDAFGAVTWPARITWDGALRLELSADSDYAVVFTERPEAVCVEPQTAPPDAAGLGLAATVVPGTPLVLNTEFSWS